MSEHCGHECGIFAAYLTNQGSGVPAHEAARLVAGGLASLQHRGQESAGILVTDGKRTKTHKGMGLVHNVFTQEDVKSLEGHIAVGHTRYSTSGYSDLKNVQPFVEKIAEAEIGVAHNGQLTNVVSLRNVLFEGHQQPKQFKTEVGKGLPDEIDHVLSEALSKGKLPDSALQRTTDSALISIALLKKALDEDFQGIPTTEDWLRWIRHFMSLCDSAYSIIFLTNKELFAVRDPHGFRPLSIGSLIQRESTHASGWIVASETCAFKHANFIREVLPGEIVRISEEGLTSYQGRTPSPVRSFCIFEYVYFSQPDSIHDGQMVHQVRQRMGYQLAIEAPVLNADVVGAVPDSSNAAAIGYSQKTGIPYNELLVRSRYLGRSFIEPTDKRRQAIIAKKFYPIHCNVKDKIIVVIDDSIVRGHTLRAVVKLLREAGAKQVHLRISSPPLKFPCFMGVDIPTREELIASRIDTMEGIREYLQADSIHYLSVNGLITATTPITSITQDSKNQTSFCGACFTGNYPVDLEDIVKSSPSCSKFQKS